MKEININNNFLYVLVWGLAIAKVAHLINVPWLVVLAPLWFPFAVWFGIIAICLLLKGFLKIYEWIIDRYNDFRDYYF